MNQNRDTFDVKLLFSLNTMILHHFIIHDSFSQTEGHNANILGTRQNYIFFQSQKSTLYGSLSTVTTWPSVLHICSGGSKSKSSNTTLWSCVFMINIIRFLSCMWMRFHVHEHVGVMSQCTVLPVVSKYSTDLQVAETQRRCSKGR